MAFKTIITITTLGLALSVVTSADEILKWTDEHGIVHYADTAPKNTRAQKLNVRAGKPSVAPPSPIPTEQPQEDKPSEKPQEVFVESQEQLAVIRENCSKAQSNLTALTNAGRIRTSDPETGENVYLSDEEKQAKIDQAKDNIAKYCNS